MINRLLFQGLIEDILKVNPTQKHDETVWQIEQIFRKYGFYTTREYPIYKMKDNSGRAGRIDLVARKGKFRVAVEYDHKYNIKYKSFQKIIQIKPDVAIGITGFGCLNRSIRRALGYRTATIPLYVVSLKEKRYANVSGYNFDTNASQSDRE